MIKGAYEQAKAKPGKSPTRRSCSKKSTSPSGRSTTSERSGASLFPVAQAAFKLIKASPQKYEEDIRKAFQQAAKDAGLSAEGRAVLLTAVNGSMPRGDNGTWELGTFADVKKILLNAQKKLEAADGAFIVDLKKPKYIENAVRDDVITNQELDRTPSSAGNTAAALLAYASVSFAYPRR